MEKVYTSEEIRNRPKESSLLPPTLANLLSGKTVIFHEAAGNVWLRVTEEVTPADVNFGWDREASKEKYTSSIEDQKTWIIPSSRSGVYEVILKSGSFSCSCPGFGFRRKCTHIDQAQSLHKQC